MTTNEQRAARALRHQLGPEDVERVAHALDVAEARGRAEVAAKVLDLANVVVQDQHLSGHRLARRLRSLAAEDIREALFRRAANLRAEESA